VATPRKPARPPARTVESVLESLRRGQRSVARDPRGALETAVKQLLSLGATRHESGAPATFRIDDLARAAGTTVRNVRAYTERGLLPPPRRVGRTALFDESHLSRLKIVMSMLDRGYSSAHITEMLGAWEQGKDLAHVLGLERALITPSVQDDPKLMSVTAARELAGGPGELTKMIDAGLAERLPDGVRVLRPKLFAAFAEMREYGLTNDTLLRLHLAIVPELDRISGLLVTTAAAHLATRFADHGFEDQVDDLVAILTRFRALAMTTVTATLASSIEQTIEGLLAEYLSSYVAATQSTGTASTG
jgi:DNA-binding transcriptional MerR regulator